MSLLDLMAWDAENQVDLIDQPLLMGAGDISDTRYMTDAVFEKATGTTDKELVLIKGANPIETYWKLDYVAKESAAVSQFFLKSWLSFLKTFSQLSSTQLFQKSLKRV